MPGRPSGRMTPQHFRLAGRRICAGEKKIPCTMVVQGTLDQRGSTLFPRIPQRDSRGGFIQAITGPPDLFTGRSEGVYIRLPESASSPGAPLCAIQRMRVLFIGLRPL